LETHQFDDPEDLIMANNDASLSEPPSAAPALANLRLGTAPDSWGVWFPDDPKQVPWHQFLNEAAAAGYTAVELGPFGYLPTEPEQLRDELGRRGLPFSPEQPPARRCTAAQVRCRRRSRSAVGLRR
jgi:hypothetical protein